MCTVPAVAGSRRRRGHVVSPGYPHRYPGAAVTGTHAINCSLTVVVRPPTALVRLRVVDLFLASYTANNRRLCRDRSIHQSVKAAMPTHTHPFDGPFPGLPGEPVPERYKKLRGTARCVVSVEILPIIATQQCRNYSYDKS